MNGKKTPMQLVNDEHGGKNKLVDKVLGLIDHGDEDADSLKARLLKASNKKLLKLAAVSEAIRDKYGSQEKLVEAVAQKLNHAKDSDFMRRLAAFSPGKLLDLARSLSHEARRPLKASLAPRPEKAPKKAAAKGKTAKAAPKKAPATRARKPAAKKPAKT